MKSSNSILSSCGTTIFTVMSALAQEHGAINLGQGFPDGEGPDDIRAAAARAVIDGPNQYPPMMGLPALRRAVAEHDKRFYGLEVDWRREVLVTSGATEALAACLLGLLDPGDEAVLFEPLYDSYLPMVRLAGATPRLVAMEPPRKGKAHWSLPREAFAAAMTGKTKLILLNSPNNPTGMVFDEDDLAFIAGWLERQDVYAVCDEVYEHIIFDGRPHVPLMRLPGMRERCLRIGSAGKTFSLTGWKVGYVTGCAQLIGQISRAHQFLTFTTPPNLQTAVAEGLAKEDGYFDGLAKEMQGKRDLLAAGLRDVGFRVFDSEGTYFLTVDFRPLGYSGDDVAFCRHITKEAGVAAVPVSAFYAENPAQGYARFCFCKDDGVLEEAIGRLGRHFG